MQGGVGLPLPSSEKPGEPVSKSAGEFEKEPTLGIKGKAFFREAGSFVRKQGKNPDPGFYRSKP